MAEPSSDIRVTLRLEQTPGKDVVAHLAFVNVGRQPALLWRRIALLDGRLTAERFNVTLDGTPLEYIGRTVKSGEPRPDEFETVQPSGMVQAAIPLSEGYEIPGHGRLEAEYEAFNPTPDGATLIPLRSNKASIDLQ